MNKEEWIGAYLEGYYDDSNYLTYDEDTDEDGNVKKDCDVFILASNVYEEKHGGENMSTQKEAAQLADLTPNISRSNITINVDFLAGTSIEDAITEAKKKAVLFEVNYVQFMFNGDKFSIGAGADVAKVVKAWKSTTSNPCEIRES